MGKSKGWKNFHPVTPQAVRIEWLKNISEAQFAELPQEFSSTWEIVVHEEVDLVARYRDGSHIVPSRAYYFSWLVEEHEYYVLKVHVPFIAQGVMGRWSTQLPLVDAELFKVSVTDSRRRELEINRSYAVHEVIERIVVELKAKYL